MENILHEPSMKDSKINIESYFSIYEVFECQENQHK